MKIRRPKIRIQFFKEMGSNPVMLEVYFSCTFLLRTEDRDTIIQVKKNLLMIRTIKKCRLNHSHSQEYNIFYFGLKHN